MEISIRHSHLCSVSNDKELPLWWLYVSTVTRSTSFHTHYIFACWNNTPPTSANIRVRIVLIRYSYVIGTTYRCLGFHQ